MKRVAISIVLNGAKHLNSQIDRMQLSFDQWIIVEGASKNIFCTAWCKQIPEEYHNNGNSIDSTLDLLNEAITNNRSPCKITLIKANGLWDGKLAMFNEAIKGIIEPCWLWEVDIDEYWNRRQLGYSEQILDTLGADVGAFSCDYLLNDDIIVRGKWGEATDHGYRRLWKYEPGRKFLSHEPPVVEGQKSICPPMLLPRFRHLSYYYEEDVIFKSKWYGNHENIYQGWKNIINGTTKLPCSVEKLFLNPVPQDWKNTLITYR